MTQHYIGTKIVIAWAQDKDGQPGYTVKYSDGYTSWCPKAKFEEANIAIGHVGHLPPYQQRVIGEKATLADNLAKLGAALNGGLKEKVSPDDYSLLCEQERVMRELDEILRRRIANFESAR